MTDFLSLAKQAYEQSTSFVDNNYRSQWEDCINHFRSQHRSGSKYRKPSFQYRSKFFRPKTRSAVRNNEAAAAAAFFANQDVVATEAQIPSNDAQRASAEVMKELLQYRLTKSIPWFVTCIAAFQDTNVIGVICSHQYWHYEERKTDGRIVKDAPCIDLLPVEHLRIHPAADWTDPVNSSPYLIHLIPMYVMDIKARMENEDQKTGEAKWKNLTDDEIRSANKITFDSTRSTRDGNREDKHDQQGKSKPLSDYDVVWVHRNFVRISGHDFVFYTLGTQHLLSTPAPIEDVYFHGDRPYVMGLAAIEAHKLYPDSIVQLGVPLQTELNENANQRADNVKLVMNKRYTVLRGKNVDLNNLLRNVAGGATMVDGHDDIKERTFDDVTTSSYAEQDRLNLDFDDLIGTFSGATVQSNRKLNETVGGMAMLRGGASSLVEYMIKTFAETWVEPVLRQLVKLEQYYETDETVLAIAAEKAQLFQKYGIDRVTDELLNQEMTLTVNVGMGATDPVLRLERFALLVDKAIALLANPVPGLNVNEVIKELFGRGGYKDGQRFLMQQDGENPEVAQLMAQAEQLNGVIQQLQVALNDKEADRQAKIEETIIKEEAADERLDKQLDNALILKHMEVQDRDDDTPNDE